MQPKHSQARRARKTHLLNQPASSELSLATNFLRSSRVRLRPVFASLGASVIAVAFSSASTTASQPLIHIEQPSTSLVTKYLAALGPAGSEIARVEKQLKALPLTSTAAQVNKVVTPLGPALKPLEKLIMTQPVAPGKSTVTLEALGVPTISYPVKGCGVAARYAPIRALVAQGSSVIMASKKWQNGFQLVTGSGCNSPETDAFTWHLPGAYKVFSAQVGLNTGSNSGATVSFLGAHDQILPFFVAGEPVTVLTLSSPTRVIDIKLPITTDQITIACTDSNGTATATIDFANDLVTR